MSGQTYMHSSPGTFAIVAGALIVVVVIGFVFWLRCGSADAHRDRRMDTPPFGVMRRPDI